MLFTYTKVPQPQGMNKLQGYIEFIFYQVWMPAQPGIEYDVLALFGGHDELLAVIEALHFKEEVEETKKGRVKKTARFFIEGIEEIYYSLAELSAADKQQIQDWFQSNNNIEGLCNREQGLSPITYTELSKHYPEIGGLFKNFYTNLYSKFLELKAIVDNCGSITDHSKAFIDVNKKGVCPFCGVTPMKRPHESGHDAYDHYLPEALYPFNPINFDNLVLACHRCNSTCKGAKDPLSYDSKIFYPFSQTQPSIDISVNIHSDNWEKLHFDDIEVVISSIPHQEQVQVWRDIYQIDTRYRELCVGENEGEYWIEQILDESQNEDKTPQEIIAKINRMSTKKPFAELNFLKRPFIEACIDRGILGSVELTKSES